MPRISTEKDLIKALGAVVYANDPVFELRARGFEFAQSFTSVLDTPGAHARLASPERQRLLANLHGRPAPRMQVGPLTRVIPLLPGGHHDLTIGLKLEKVNEVLTDVYLKHSIPRDISLGSGDTASSLGTLLSILRYELVGVPVGDDIRIGQLHLTGPPRVTAMATTTPPNAPVDVTARLLVHLPVTLDFDRLPPNAPGQNAVATLRAIAHFGIAVSASVEGNTLAIDAGPLPHPVDPLNPERLRLTIDPGSPLRPKNNGSGDRIGLALEVGGFQRILRGLAISATLAPRVTLPIGPGFDVLVRHIDLRAVLSNGAGHLMVGLEIGAQVSPVPLQGQPDLLERDPFDASGSTLYVEANAELFKVLVRQAFASGELQQLAKEQAENILLSEVDAELGANSIGLFLKGTLVNECGLFGTGFKDVSFDGWTRFELRGVDAGHIRYETVDTIGVGAADGTDVAICVLLSFLDLKILSIAKALLETFFSRLSGWLIPTVSVPDQITNLFDPNFPIPMTELLPRVRALSATIDKSAMRIQAKVDLVHDTINTYVYVRCEGLGPPEVGGGMPVKGVQVRLLDQDAPAPAGDDVAVPKVGTTTGGTARRWRRVAVTFAPPSVDQQLAMGTTDSQGRVQLVLTPEDIISGAGVVTTSTLVANIQTLEIITNTTEHHAITELLPDLYFLLEVRNRPRIDTRSVSGGFARNFSSKRWGTAEQPLVFRVPRPGLDVG